MVVNKKIACFVTADENYFFPAVVTIESFRRFFPDIDYFILTNTKKVSHSSIDKVMQNNIFVIHTEKFELYEANSSWPKICYAIFSGPEILYKLGYGYSISLDADVFCANKFDLELIIENTDNFAGIVNDDPILGNLKNVNKFLEDFKINSKSIDGLVNPNTGIVFWNNQWAKDYLLENAIYELYLQIKSNVIPGDQSLLAAFIMVHGIMYNHLEHTMNFRTGHVTDWLLPISMRSIKIIHFTSPKPWSRKKFYNKRNDENINIYLKKIILVNKWQIFIKRNQIKNNFRKMGNP